MLGCGVLGLDVFDAGVGNQFPRHVLTQDRDVGFGVAPDVGQEVDFEVCHQSYPKSYLTLLLEGESVAVVSPQSHRSMADSLVHMVPQ